MRGIILGIFVVLFSANLSSADIVATWQMKDGANTKLSIRDDKHVRIDTNEKDTYMLVKDKKVYMVRKEEGQWTAFDMDQMADMMKMFGKKTSSSIKLITKKNIKTPVVMRPSLDIKARCSKSSTQTIAAKRKQMKWF